jgi:hypothetical protein
MTTPSFFRRRTIGRAASPPTWACYEQIPYDDDDEEDDCSDSNSEDNSCSEDGDDYGVHGNNAHGGSDSESEHVSTGDAAPAGDKQDESLDMDIDGETGEGDGVKKNVGFQKDVKGKQRAIEPEPESPKRHHRRKRREVYTLRPILTIQRSQGFVWNQVCVPVSSLYRRSLMPFVSGSIRSSLH